MQNISNNQTRNAEEQSWLKHLSNGDEKALELIFERYYKYLVVTAFNYLKDDEGAKDLVQEVFLKFWEQRGRLNVQHSLQAFLRKSVINKSIDSIRKRKDIRNVALSEIRQEANTEDMHSRLETKDLQVVVNNAIETLPEKCKMVFSLSRFEDMSHREIGELLGISTKTIENQMTKAIKIIRLAVKKYQQHTPLILLWIINIFNFA